MTIDVSEILKEAAESIKVAGEVAMPDTEFMGMTYHFEKPVSIRGSVSNNGKSLILRAVCEGEFVTRCSRCAKDITVPVCFDIEESMMRDGGGETDEDVILFTDTDIDIDDVVRDNFLMNIEGQYLCSEDCKGLCPECGADLNLGECGCSREYIDPRWASLIDIMNKDN